MMSTPNPLLAHLLAARPFIPELHADDCDDVSCVRCAKPTPVERMDVPLAVVESALRIREQFARVDGPQLPECAHCGNRRGPLVPEPHQARYANNAQVLVCRDRCTPADPERHALDPDEPVYAADAVSYTAVATDADYPAWAAQLAAQTKQPGRAS